MRASQVRDPTPTDARQRSARSHLRAHSATAPPSTDPLDDAVGIAVLRVRGRTGRLLEHLEQLPQSLVLRRPCAGVRHGLPLSPGRASRRVRMQSDRRARVRARARRDASSFTPPVRAAASPTCRVRGPPFFMPWPSFFLNALQRGLCAALSLSLSLSFLLFRSFPFSLSFCLCCAVCARRPRAVWPRGSYHGREDIFDALALALLMKACS